MSPRHAALILRLMANKASGSSRQEDTNSEPSFAAQKMVCPSFIPLTGGFMAKTKEPQNFAKQGFRCLGIDHRNTGETRPFTTDQGYTHPDEYIDDLIACGLAVFGPGVHVRMVGYSIGAYFVQWAQHRYPDHVVAGVNVSGGLFKPIPEEVDYGDIEAVMGGNSAYQDGRWWSVEWFKSDQEQAPPKLHSNLD